MPKAWVGLGVPGQKEYHDGYHAILTANFSPLYNYQHEKHSDESNIQKMRRQIAQQIPKGFEGLVAPIENKLHKEI